MTLTDAWEDDVTWQKEFNDWIRHPSANTNYLVQVLKTYVMKNGKTNDVATNSQSLFGKALRII